MKTIAILTTTDSLERARDIAAALIARKLAACVQISPIESVYTWQGATRNDREFRLLAKTVAGNYAEVESAIRELHSYDLPAIFAIDVSEAFAPYAEWVADNSTGAADRP
jgi:periplasmic divalent cation tolerance protein